jgi:2-polyprenyl-3-methyl-5-hydroxy-6-metoxy-1,4-benzoquinol methylase
MSKKKYTPHAWETVNCLVCNSTKSVFYERFGSELQFTYVKCTNCKLVYQSPRPKYDAKFIEDAYGNYFQYDPYYCYPTSKLRRWDKELGEIIKFDKKRTAILDVGSNMGDFLKVSQKYYSKCLGVEVAENMARCVEDRLHIKVYVGLYTEINFNEKYSCIHMSHVIEHIPNPKEWMAKTKLILDRDGVLVISVPNVNALQKQIKLLLKRIGLREGKWKDNSRTPDHLFEPNISSMLHLFGDTGYTILDYYSYSRKDMDASTWFGKLYNRKLKLGSNLRFFVTPHV